jgi:hypothetical protein
MNQDTTNNPSCQKAKTMGSTRSTRFANSSSSSTRKRKVAHTSLRMAARIGAAMAYRRRLPRVIFRGPRGAPALGAGVWVFSFTG